MLGAAAQLDQRAAVARWHLFTRSKMHRFLDPRFKLVAALIDDPGYSAEARLIVRQQAEAIAASCGFSFSDAVWHAGLQMLPFVARREADDGPVEPSAEQHMVDNIGNPDAISEPVVKCRHGGDDGQIDRALKANPGRSDRDLAREFGVSPTTVGKARKALGLSAAVRNVTRGGKPYAMQLGDRS